MRIELPRVEFMPKELAPGVLYVAEEYDAAAHLCACGCGSKIRTPLGPTEWTLVVAKSGPSLSPSVGNWQQVCQSHYLIEDGEARWAAKWTPEQIATGYRREEARRRDYYRRLYRQRGGVMRRLWCWVKGAFAKGE